LRHGSAEGVDISATRYSIEDVASIKLHSNAVHPQEAAALARVATGVDDEPWLVRAVAMVRLAGLLDDQ